MALLIPIAYAALGAFSMVVQTILLREFFVIAAGSEISFGIAISGWLIGVGAGSLAGAFFRARNRSTAGAFAWASLAMCAAAPLLLAAIRSLHLLGAMPQGGPLPLAKTFYLIPALTVPFSALSGFAFPLADKLAPLAAGRARAAMAGAYMWECLGALAGGSLYTFGLVGKCPPLSIVALLSLPLLAGAAIVSRSGRCRGSCAAVLLALACVAAALFSGGTGGLDARLTRQRWQGISSLRLAAVRDTRFQNLQLGSSGGQFSLFSNGQLAAVFPDDEVNRVLAAQLLTQHRRPRHILVIGDVSAGVAKHLLSYPIASLTAVEIDAGYTALVREHLNSSDVEALNDPRLRIVPMDGRRFVHLAGQGGSGRPGRFDLAFIHQPDAWTAQLNRYYTREFFIDLKGILAPGGVVALRLASAENYASEIITPYTATIFRTLRSVFPAVAVSPGMVNALFASPSRASVSQDPELLAGRYRAMAAPPADLAPIFASLYPAEKTAFISAALEKSEVRTLNRDNRPIAYFLGGRLLGWTSGSPLAGLFDLLQKTTLPAVLLLLGALLLPWALRAWLRRGQGAGNAPVLLAAASGGFAGLAVENAAIFIFQNKWGFVYQAIGMLIALFMLGLGAGAAWTSRRIERKPPSRAAAARKLAVVQVSISLLGLACLPLLAVDSRLGWPAQVLLAGWLGGVGLLVGSILPLGLRALDRLPAGQSAGLLNAGDYLGGAAGSLLTAAVFLPLLGTGSSMLIVSFLTMASAALLLVAARGPAGES